ncbi:exodeoxyribonuclease VII large subunit [candidate division WOR-3 bacterium]|nr:exodeoxyribonuclease VII large subunit [candidate division WOR-3 bacterium]
MLIYSVSEITSTIRKQILNIGWVWVQGEISNLTYHKSGHIYFSMKDENAVIRGVIFRREAGKLEFELEEGRIFQIYGRIDIWEGSSQYQIIGEKVLPGELGQFYLKFQEIKEKLEKKGYFEEKNKKPLPHFPKKIGIITSAEGAAVRDVLKILIKRFPCINVIVRPTMVQGNEAPDDIITAIEEFEELGGVDTLILTRGGGSIEDLWAFNDERVAEAVFKCKIPIISAVGHERDFSISDFVADKRAATPTEAGELAVPDIKEIDHLLENIRYTIINYISQKIKTCILRLKAIEKSYAIRRPLSIFELKEQQLDYLYDKLTKEIKSKINKNKEKINGLENILQATSYKKTLARGYSITRKGKKIIKDSSKLKEKDLINIEFHKGKSTAIVKKTKK